MKVLDNFHRRYIHAQDRVAEYLAILSLATTGFVVLNVLMPLILLRDVGSLVWAIPLTATTLLTYLLSRTRHYFWGILLLCGLMIGLSTIMMLTYRAPFSLLILGSTFFIIATFLRAIYSTLTILIVSIITYWMIGNIPGRWAESEETLLWVTISGVIIAGMKHVRDLNEIRLLEAQNRAHQAELKLEHTKILNSFVNKAGHEFRTPLAIIGTNTYLMQRTQDPDTLREKGKSIESQIARITTILDSIFSLQKLSDTNWRTQRVNISELLANLIKELKASRQQHTVSYAVPEKILLAIGNYDYLLEAFRQVLDNACRFTSLGEAIKVDVSDDGKQVFVDVRDDGIGIEEKDLPHVFEAFWRHDDAHTTPGLGVGLTIAREIITRHNGVIDIASKPNNGTHVRITLPLATDTDSGTKDKR